jgi:hypothetical protein
MNRNLILLRYGHRYLFWASGQYNVLELSKKYDICLIVGYDYKADSEFQKFIANNKIDNVLYEPQYNVKRIKDYISTITNFIIENNPYIIIQNDYIEVQNMYIFCISRDYEKDRIHIVLPVSAPSTKKLFLLFNEARLARVRNIIPNKYLSKFILYFLMIGKRGMSVIHNYLIPIIVGVSKPYLTNSLYNNIDNIPKYIPFDYFLTNDKLEVDYLKNLIPTASSKIYEIRSSEYIFTKQEKKSHKHNSILFVPSLVLLNGVSILEKSLWEKWANILKIIINKEGIVDISIKFHPSLKKFPNDVILMKNYFQQKFPEAKIYKEDYSIESLVKQHNIIVGDVSSILIRARYFNEKKIISIDFNNFSGSDTMKEYPEINYFREGNNLTNLSSYKIKICKYHTS